MIKDAYIIISCNNPVKIILMSFGGSIQEMLFLGGNKSFRITITQERHNT